MADLTNYLLVRLVALFKSAASFSKRLMLVLIRETCDTTWHAAKVALGYALGFTVGMGMVLFFIKEIVPISFAFSELLVVCLRFLLWLLGVTR